MQQIIKISLPLVIICLVLGVAPVVLAQETTLEEDLELDEEVEPEDLEIKEPKILPGSRLYFLKEWGRGILSFFSFGRIKKSELEQKFANERLMELKALVEEGEQSEIIKKATEKYEKSIEKIQAHTEKIKEKAGENEEVSKFLDKFTKHQLLHQKVLEKLEEQVSKEVFQTIKKARERHLERFGEVMTKLEDRGEKIKERLEEQMEEQEGSKFKNFKNLEVLIELEEKVAEQAKEAIRQAQENALKRLQDDLEKMATPDQERFKEYLERISGDKEKQLEILENLRLELRERVAAEKVQLRERIDEAREAVLEKVRERIQETVQERTCPEVDKPAPGFCSEGRIVVRKDENSCLIEFKCLIPAEFEISPVLPTLPEKPLACIALWNPVCGKDGKTYSNSCYAELAGTEISYKGSCQEKECNADYECPQPRCGPLGTISARCMGVKAKCLEGKCQIVEQ